jgi:hypothetical protein
MDIQLSPVMQDFSREESPKSITLGHELFHAQYLLFGLILERDERSDSKRIDWDQVMFPDAVAPLMNSLSHHEWKVRCDENLLRAQQGLKLRHNGYYHFNLVDELMDMHEDFVDTFTD